jgi:BirA family transcriptional regulator, biotin operon repressor / biotin---[acetyl-CoA-carboxylase] ligase
MEALRCATGSSPAEVHGWIERLRGLGYGIAVSPALGYRLEEPPATLSAELIEYGLGTRYIGRKVLVYDTTDSTNDVAWDYAREPDSGGLAVFAERQRVGRGRLGRNWSAAKGSSVLCSVLVRGETVNQPSTLNLRREPHAQEQKISNVAHGEGMGASLSLMGGLAAAEAIEKTAGIPTAIKWPNDVLIGGRKAAGTMVESRRINGWLCYVIGVGINCRQRTEDFPAELRDRAVSIEQITGRKVDRVQLSQKLLGRMDYWWERLAAVKLAELHDAWLGRCGDIGGRVTLACDGRRFSGRVIDVLVRDGLLMQLDDGSVRVFDGAVCSRAVEEK